MTPSNDTKKKADNLIDTANLQAVASFDAFRLRFPEIEDIMKNRETSDWVYYMTIGATAAAVMGDRELTGEESTEIVQSLSNWNSNAQTSLEGLLGFIDIYVKPGVDHFAALGLWVLTSIKNEQPKQEETTLAAVIGQFLRNAFADSWDSF